MSTEPELCTAECRFVWRVLIEFGTLSEAMVDNEWYDWNGVYNTMTKAFTIYNIWTGYVVFHAMMTKLLCLSVWMVVLMFTVTDCSPHKWHLARFLYDKPSRAWQDNIIPLSPHDPLTLSHKTNIIRCRHNFCSQLKTLLYCLFSERVIHKMLGKEKIKRHSVKVIMS